ncbi:unnamed protein product, partial [Rotaria sordida]
NTGMQTFEYDDNITSSIFDQIDRSSSFYFNDWSGSYLNKS